MIKEIKFPALDENKEREFDDAILHWSVEDGQIVKTDDIIATLDTDKATIELTSEHSGVIKICERDGKPYVKGQIIARIKTTDK